MTAELRLEVGNLLLVRLLHGVGVEMIRQYANSFVQAVRKLESVQHTVVVGHIVEKD